MIVRRVDVERNELVLTSGSGFPFRWGDFADFLDVMVGEYLQCGPLSDGLEKDNGKLFAKEIEHIVQACRLLQTLAG